MEFLRDHAMEIIQWLWPPFAQHLDYAINAEAHVQALTRATEELRCKRKDVEGDHGEGPSRKRRKPMMTHQAQHWIDELTDIEKEADSIKSEFEERRRRFLNGRFTDYFSCYNLGKRAVEMLNAVKYLNEKGALGQAVVSPPRPKVVPMQESLPSGQSTSQETLEEIWQCLQDDDTRIVCLYGMGGIGKTTLMKTINNRLIGTQDFDIVIWVTVTKKFDLERIQKEIGNILCLDFQDEIQKSDKLFAVLKDMKYMLILDDLWHEFILEEAGIPRPNRQNGCKIAITTRSIHVGNGMQADKNIGVKTLTREESWNLFCNKAGEVAHLPGIQSVAEEIAMECGGLPRAIATVGRTMRCKEKKELWLDAWRSLRRSAPEAPECRGLTRISQVVGGSKRLRQLQVNNFKGIDCVIDWREVGEGALRRLEWMCLDGLLNLKMLFQGEVPQGCLQHLRSIEVSCCKKLRCLFSSTVVDHLVGLEELTVQSCDEMVEIVEGDVLPNNQPFPRLRQLRVERLCNLSRIISGTASALTSLQEVEVFKCPSLKKLPSCTSIQKIKGEREWWDAVEWEDESARSVFHQKYHQWPSFQIDEASS